MRISRKRRHEAMLEQGMHSGNTDAKFDPPPKPNYDPADPDKMRLPVGTTCGDCHHIRRCKAMFGHVETDTYCDWAPSRFEVPRNPVQGKETADQKE